MQDYNVMIDTLSVLVNFASYFIFSFVGSLLKEVYATNSNKTYRFEPYKVVISTLVALLIAIAVKGYYSEILDNYWGIMGIISLVLGFIGFEIFNYISTIRGIRKIFGVFDEPSVLDNVDDILDEENEKESKKKLSYEKNKTYKQPVVNGSISRTIHEPTGKLIEYKISKPIIHSPEENDENK